METIPDFSKVRRFPGTLDNDIDVVLRGADHLERLPALLIAGLLFLLAIPPTRGHWGWTVGLWAFFLLDWLLMALLPRLGRSYGPPKPPTLILAVLRMLFAFLPFPIAVALQGVGTLLVVEGFWIEPMRLGVSYQKLTSPKLRKGSPVRVLHLGDLHIERITQRERRLNQLINELRPDLIIFSGDILNLSYTEDPLAIAQAREIIGQWRAPHGVFVVTGSPAVDLEQVFPRLMEGLDQLHWLKKERVSLCINDQAIDVAGLTCSHKPFLDAPALEELFNPPSGHFTILAYHTPDLAPNVARTGQVDLQLSGHTHGGQVRLPVIGALVAGSLYGKRFEAGRYSLGNMTLYVSRGIGMEGKGAPRVRFLCPPEIILWEIDGA